MIKKAIKKGAAPVLCGLLLFLFMRFVFFIGYVPSASMEPAIGKGTFIFGIRMVDQLERGDIIVFRLNGLLHVKRIAALPGETVYIDTETMTVLYDEGADTLHAVTVPEDSFFLLGDNTADSLDSRFWEAPCIPKTDILARLLWP